MYARLKTADKLILETFIESTDDEGPCDQQGLVGFAAVRTPQADPRRGAGCRGRTVMRARQTGMVTRRPTRQDTGLAVAFNREVRRPWRYGEGHRKRRWRAP